MHTLNTRMLILSLALFFSLGLFGAAVAHAGKGFCGVDAQKQEFAKLSPEKQELAKKLYKDFHDDTKALRQELQSKRQELNTLLHSEKPDDKAIQAMADEISGLRAKLYSARIDLKSKLIKEGIPVGKEAAFGKKHGKRGDRQKSVQ